MTPKRDRERAVGVRVLAPRHAGRHATQATGFCSAKAAEARILPNRRDYDEDDEEQVQQAQASTLSLRKVSQVLLQSEFGRSRLLSQSLHPPATISISTGEEIHQRGKRKSGAAAASARRGPQFEQVRLVGSIPHLSVAESQLAQLPKWLGLLLKPAKPRNTEAKWGWNRKAPGYLPPTKAPQELWDRTTGGVTGQGFCSANELLKNLRWQSSPTRISPSACSMPSACSHSQIRRSGLPLIRCIIVPPRELPTKAAKGKARQRQ